MKLVRCFPETEMTRGSLERARRGGSSRVISDERGLMDR